MRLRLVIAAVAVLVVALVLMRSPQHETGLDPEPAAVTLRPAFDAVSLQRTSTRSGSSDRAADAGRRNGLDYSPRQRTRDSQDDPGSVRSDSTAQQAGGEAAVLRRARVVAKTPRSSFTIPAGNEADVRPVRMVWRNLDNAVAVVPYLKRRNQPDLTSVDAMVASLMQPGLTDEQRATAVWTLLSERLYYHPPNDGGDEFHDPVKLVNVYGYGICDDFAAAFVELCRRAGYRARTYELGGHVVGEVYYNDDWHMFDPSFKVFYRRPDGRIAGVRYLEQHPELVLANVPVLSGWSPEQMMAIYASWEDNRPYELPDTPGFRHETCIAPLLEPGDIVVFDWDDDRRVHRSRAYPDGPDPPQVANGLHTRVVDVENLEFRQAARYGEFHWPFVVLGAEVCVHRASAGKRVGVSFSNEADGVDWEPLESRIQHTTLDASADAWLSRQTVVPYGYCYRLDSADGVDPARCAYSVVLKSVFQFAPRNRPHVRPGENVFDISLEFPQGRPRSAWQGVEIELVWQEALHSQSPSVRAR